MPIKVSEQYSCVEIFAESLLQMVPERLKNLFIPPIQAIRKLMHRPFIHAIGDSHALSFLDVYCHAHHVGAATAHNLNREDSTTMGRRKVFEALRNVEEKDVVLLVFGEIDCRIHIFCQHMKHAPPVSIDTLVDETVANYGEVIKEIHLLHKRTSVFNVVPPGPQENIYNYEYYAPWEKRLEITLMFNSKLKRFCDTHGIHFVDVYSCLIIPDAIDPLQYRSRRYVKDDIHLNSRIVKLVRSDLERYALL